MSRQFKIVPPKHLAYAFVLIAATALSCSAATAQSIVAAVNQTLEPSITPSGALKPERYRCLALERYLIDTMPVSTEKGGLVKFTDDTGAAVVDLIELEIDQSGAATLKITVRGTGLSQSFSFTPLKKDLAGWDTWGHKDGVVGTYLYRNPSDTREFRMLTRTLVINPDYMADSILKFKCY